MYELDIKLVKIRIETGKPKRKSGVYVNKLNWGYRPITHRRNEGILVDLRVFHKYQLEEGPDIFDGHNFRLIPYEWSLGYL